MAYATTNPPSQLIQGPTGGASLWYYTSADVDSDVDASGYFTNGAALGMKVGDFMLVFDTAGVGSFMVVTVVTAGAAATVAFGAVA